MKIKRSLTAVVLVCTMIFSSALLLPTSALGEETAEVLYHIGDIEAMNALIIEHGLEYWLPPVPSPDGMTNPGWCEEIVGWDGEWYNEMYMVPPYRIWFLSLGWNDMDIDIRGHFDVGGLPRLGIFGVRDTDITSIDVSNNPYLGELFVVNTNITSIDLSNNPNIWVLSLPYNYLTELDFSNNPILWYLNLSHNYLSELDFSNNPGLSHVNVSNNNLTGLDVSGLERTPNLDVRYNFILSQDDIIGLRLEGPWRPAFQFEPQRTGTPPTPPVPSPTPHFGDVNNSGGSPDDRDIYALRHYITGHRDTGVKTSAADLNGDGVVNVLDLTLLRLYLAGHDVMLGSEE